MADDSTVQIKITGQLDPSLLTATAAAKRAIEGLDADMAAAVSGVQALAQRVSGTSAPFFNLGTSISGLQFGLSGLSKGLRTLNTDLGVSHGAMSTAAREGRALFDELSSGRVRMIPGTLAILAQRVLGIGPGALASAAAMGGFVAALGYAEYQSIEAERELEKLAAGFELTGRGASVSKGFIEQWVTSTWKIFDSAGETTKKIVEMEAANGRLNATIISAANQVIPVFIKQYGDDAPKAMEKLLGSLGDLSAKGFEKLNADMLNLSPTQYAAIERMIDLGHETQAATTILEILGERGGVAVKSLQGKLQELQGEAVKMRAAFLTDQDATDGLTRASVEYLRVLREIQSVKQAITNAPKEQADKSFVEEINLANDINSKLTQRGQILKSLASLQEGLNNAEKTGDKDLIASFTQAIANEQSQLTAIDKRETDKRLAEQRRAYQEWLQGITTTASQIESILQRDVDSDIRRGREALTVKKRDLDQAVADRQISADDELQILLGLYSDEADLEIARLRAHQQANANDVAIYDEDAQKILAIYQWLFGEIDRLQHDQLGQTNKFTKDQEAAYRSMVRGITQAEDGLVQNILEGRTTLKGALLQFSGQLLENEIRNDLKIYTSKALYNLLGLENDKTTQQESILTMIFGEDQKTAAAAAGDAARTAAHDAAQSQGMAADVALGSSQIMNDAYKAASGAYSAVVGIPYVGPILAPIAAGTAFAAVAAFDTLTSAEGGAWEVDGGFFRLHEKESVIPAQIASPMRDFFEGGGQSQQPAPTNINVNMAVQAWNGQSVSRMVSDRVFQRKLARAMGKTMTLNPSTRGAF